MRNKSHKGYYSRGYLPHFDQPGLTQFVTFHLADSLPRSAHERMEYERQFDNRTDRFDFERALDGGFGACWLQNPKAAEVVEKALFHFNGERYELIAWVIMPNHVHVPIKIRDGHPLSGVIHSWKSYTSKTIKERLMKDGSAIGERLWCPEYFDRFIRDEKHFAACVEYIHNNPVKAGLVEKAEDWPWSSASTIRM